MQAKYQGSTNTNKNDQKRFLARVPCNPSSAEDLQAARSHDFKGMCACVCIEMHLRDWSFQTEQGTRMAQFMSYVR